MLVVKAMNADLRFDGIECERVCGCRHRNRGRPAAQNRAPSDDADPLDAPVTLLPEGGINLSCVDF
jgi:hypothetical protein